MRRKGEEEGKKEEEKWKQEGMSRLPPVQNMAPLSHLPASCSTTGSRQAFIRDSVVPGTEWMAYDAMSRGRGSMNVSVLREISWCFCLRRVDSSKMRWGWTGRGGGESTWMRERERRLDTH